MTPETGPGGAAADHLLHLHSLLHRRSEAILGAEQCAEHVHLPGASAPPPGPRAQHPDPAPSGPAGDAVPGVDNPGPSITTSTASSTTVVADERETGMGEHTRTELVEHSSTPAPDDDARRGRFVAWVRRIFGLGEDNLNDPLRLIAALAVAGVTGVISYTTLADLAAGMGFGEPGSHMFPIGIDAAVFLFTRAWMNRRLSVETQTFAKWAAVFFTIMSVLGNSIQHGKATYDTWNARRAEALTSHHVWQPGPLSVAWLVATIAFSALMPLALGLALHVISRVTDDARQGADEKAEAERTAATPRKTAKRRPAPTAKKDTPPSPTEQPKETPPEPDDQDTVNISDLTQYRERPDWLTDDLAKTAKTAMFAYLDRHPNATGAELDRFGERWLGTSKNYGRGVRREWLAARSDPAEDDPAVVGAE